MHLNPGNFKLSRSLARWSPKQPKHMFTLFQAANELSSHVVSARFLLGTQQETSLPGNFHTTWKPSAIPMTKGSHSWWCATSTIGFNFRPGPLFLEWQPWRLELNLGQPEREPGNMRDAENSRENQNDMNLLEHSATTQDEMQFAQFRQLKQPDQPSSTCLPSRSKQYVTCLHMSFQRVSHLVASRKLLCLATSILHGNHLQFPWQKAPIAGDVQLAQCNWIQLSWNGSHGGWSWTWGSLSGQHEGCGKFTWEPKWHELTRAFCHHSGWNAICSVPPAQTARSAKQYMFTKQIQAIRHLSSHVVSACFTLGSQQETSLPGNFHTTWKPSAIPMTKGSHSWWCATCTVGFNFRRGHFFWNGSHGGWSWTWGSLSGSPATWGMRKICVRTKMTWTYSNILPPLRMKCNLLGFASSNSQISQAVHVYQADPSNTSLVFTCRFSVFHIGRHQETSLPGNFHTTWKPSAIPMTKGSHSWRCATCTVGFNFRPGPLFLEWQPRRLELNLGQPEREPSNMRDAENLRENQNDMNLFEHSATAQDEMQFARFRQLKQPDQPSSTCLPSRSKQYVTCLHVSFQRVSQLVATGARAEPVEAAWAGAHWTWGMRKMRPNTTTNMFKHSATTQDQMQFASFLRMFPPK